MSRVQHFVQQARAFYGINRRTWPPMGRTRALLDACRLACKTNAYKHGGAK